MYSLPHISLNHSPQSIIQSIRCYVLIHPINEEFKYSIGNNALYKMSVESVLELDTARIEECTGVGHRVLVEGGG